MIMNKENRLKYANETVRKLIEALPKGFVPQNQPSLVTSKSEHADRTKRMQSLRADMGSYNPQDNVEMIRLFNRIPDLIELHQQACCGELSMYVYNFVRDIEPASQIMTAPSTKSTTDRHAFVVMGVPESWDEPKKFSEIAAAYKEAVVVDYWAGQEYYWAEKNAPGVYEIGTYEEKARMSLSDYDLKKCIRWSITGSVGFVND